MGGAPRSGYAEADSLRLVLPGRVTLFDVGAALGHDLVFGLLAGAVALGRDAVVVDGGNAMDVHRLVRAGRVAGLSPEAILDGVRIARGFTAYQFQALVEDALPAEVGPACGLVMASALPELYMDEDLRRGEACVLARRALAALGDLAASRDVPVVVTNPVLSPRSASPLRRILEEGVDEVVGLLPGGGGALRVHVPRRGIAVLAPGPGSRQRRLEEYGSRGVADARARPEDEAGFVRRSPDAHLHYVPKRAGEMRVRVAASADAAPPRKAAVVEGSS